MATEEFTLEFKTQREWEWLAVLDFFLAGGGAGLFLLGVFLAVPIATVLGVIATALGSVALLADLGRPERFWRAVAKPGTSWISRGVILVSAFLLFGAIHAAPTISWLSWLPWEATTGLGALARVIATIAAVGVMAYTGFLLSFSPAIPAWHSTLLPILFIASSLLSATGVIFLLTPTLDVPQADLRTWEQMGLVLILTSLILVLAYILTMLSSTLAARQAIQQLTRGDLSLPFLGGVLLVGLVAPLVLAGILFLAETPVASASLPLAIAGVLLVIGGVLLRYSLLRSGVYQPMV